MTGRAWVAFIAVSMLWGIPYLFIKVAIDGGVPPAFLAWVRVTLGAAILLPVAARAGSLQSLTGRARPLASFGAIGIAVPFWLIATGEQHVASSLTAILIAAAPLFVALLALRFDRSERADSRRLLGLLVGLAGVLVLVGVDVSGDGDQLAGAAAILVAAVCYAAGPMIIKLHLADLDPRATMGVSLGLAATFLAPAAAIEPPPVTPSPRAIVALVLLGVLCTAAAYVLYGALIAEVGAGRAVVITYVAPIVAVTVGVAVLGEEPGVGAVAGLLLILAGSRLATGGGRPSGTSCTASDASPGAASSGRRSRHSPGQA
jgi:drug/metabolite transporter (DMT)-like permease